MHNSNRFIQTSTYGSEIRLVGKFSEKNGQPILDIYNKNYIAYIECYRDSFITDILPVILDTGTAQYLYENFDLFKGRKLLLGGTVRVLTRNNLSTSTMETKIPIRKDMSKHRGILAGLFSFSLLEHLKSQSTENNSDFYTFNLLDSSSFPNNSLSNSSCSLDVTIKSISKIILIRKGDSRYCTAMCNIVNSKGEPVKDSLVCCNFFDSLTDRLRELIPNLVVDYPVKSDKDRIKFDIPRSTKLRLSATFISRPFLKEGTKEYKSKISNFITENNLDQSSRKDRMKILEFKNNLLNSLPEGQVDTAYEFRVHDFQIIKEKEEE